MSLGNYRDLREKVVDQMKMQAKEVKVITVEQWAKRNGFGDVCFGNYEEAKKWIEENVSGNNELMKSLYDFEGEVDDELEGLTEELENGSSSAFTRKTREISKKYITPTMKALITAAAINFLSTHAVGRGIATAGKAAYTWAIDAIDRMDLANNVNDLFKENAGPFVKEAAVAVIKYLREKRVLEKIKSGEDIDASSDPTIDASVESSEDRVAKKRVALLKNVGRTQQMKYIVQQMQDLFKEQGIAIPDIPEDCVTMEEYGQLLRDSLENQKVPNEDKDMVYTSLDIYKNNIGKALRELKMGKTGIVTRTKEAIKGGIDQISKAISNVETRVAFGIRSVTRNALKNVTKEDVYEAEKIEEKTRTHGNQSILGMA